MSLSISWLFTTYLILSANAQTSTTSASAFTVEELEEDLLAVNSIRIPEATSDLSLEELLEKDSVAAKKWQLVLDSEIYSNQADHIQTKSKAKITSSHSLYYRYSLSPTLSARASLDFEMNSVPNEAERATSITSEMVDGKTFQGTRLTDPFVSIKNITPEIWGSTGLKVETRFYFPTSETSRFEKREGRVRLDMSSAWVVGKWDIGFYFNPRYVFFRDSEDTLSMREYLMVNYNFSDKISAYSLMGQRQNSSENAWLHSDQIINYFELGSNYVVNPQWTVFAYVVNMFKQGQDKIYLLNARKNEFALGSTLSF